MLLHRDTSDYKAPVGQTLASPSTLEPTSSPVGDLHEAVSQQEGKGPLACGLTETGRDLRRAWRDPGDGPLPLRAPPAVSPSSLSQSVLAQDGSWLRGRSTLATGPGDLSDAILWFDRQLRRPGSASPTVVWIRGG